MDKYAGDMHKMAGDGASPAMVDPLLRLGLAIIEQAVKELVSTDSPLVFLDCLHFLSRTAPEWLEVANIQVDDQDSIISRLWRVYAYEN